MKSAKGLYQFFKGKYPAERKFYDLIPPLLEKKYLKTIYNCHLCAGTLGGGSPTGNQVSSNRGQRGEKAIIYLKTKDILSRTKLSKLAHRKRSGDAGGGNYVDIFRSIK
jgi:hypothetical protein